MGGGDGDSRCWECLGEFVDFTIRKGRDGVVVCGDEFGYVSGALGEGGGSILVGCADVPQCGFVWASGCLGE